MDQLRRTSRKLNVLPVVCSQEYLFLSPDDDVPVVPHDIGDERNDGEGHGGS